MQLFFGFTYLEIGTVETAFVAHRSRCQNNWYINLLYANNFNLIKYVFLFEFYNFLKQCIGQIWYLASEMQMFLFPPLLLYPLWRYKRFGKVTTAFWCLFSIVVPLTIAAVYQWPLDPLRTYFTIIKSF